MHFQTTTSLSGTALRMTAGNPANATGFDRSEGQGSITPDDFDGEQIDNLKTSDVTTVLQLGFTNNVGANFFTSIRVLGNLYLAADASYSNGNFTWGGVTDNFVSGQSYSAVINK